VNLDDRHVVAAGSSRHSVDSSQSRSIAREHDRVESVGERRGRILDREDELVPEDGCS